MELSNLIWLLFLVVTFVLPSVRKALLDRARRAMVTRLEQARGSKVITIACP